MRPAVLFKAVTLLAALPLIAVSGACAQKLAKVKEVDGEPVRRVLPKDGIPAIDNPKFVTAAKAKFLRDSDPVIGVVHQGIAKAYSAWYLDDHEIVNDQFGTDPVMVTW